MQLCLNPSDVKSSRPDLEGENDTPSRLRTLAFLTSCSVQSLVVSVTSRTRFEHRPARTNPAVKALHFQDTRRRGERVKSPNSSNYALLFFPTLLRLSGGVVKARLQRQL